MLRGSGSGDRSNSQSAAAGINPHPVTASQADRLAVMRFLNYRGRGVHFRTQLSSAQGQLTIDGDVDYRQRLGYAQLSASGA